VNGGPSLVGDHVLAAPVPVSEPLLRFDGGEVLQVIADVSAHALDEPVEQRREVQRGPRGPLVVAAVRVYRRAVLVDPFRRTGR
jgi:hypothetical protein